ncbi:MAG: serine/threonine protein kinase [Bacteroidaceae bacterium]|nr:serine/threonine protein kinase [Bacteroidaceae bacterium]
MIESESFRPIAPSADYSGRYTDVEFVRATSHAKLYRMRKAGRLFIAKSACGDDARSIELLKREYELTLGLSHPHIIHVYTYETDTPVGAAIIMEYVEGYTLTEYLAEHPDKASRVRIFEQLLAAAEYLHKAGVLHNDLKPDNILITRKNHDVRLIDFGFADDDSHYHERMLGGTQGYASPELAGGKGAIDARSDVYALGRIMQQLFPGRYRYIVRQCIHPDCEHRYANVEQLTRAWKRRRLPLQVMGVLVVLAMICLPTLLYLNERTERIRYTDSISREQQLLDSLYWVVDEEYKANFLLTHDSINFIDPSKVEQPYYEAMLMIANYFYRMEEVKNEVVSSVTDKTMQTQLEGYSNRVYTTYQLRLVEAANQWATTMPFN